MAPYGTARHRTGTDTLSATLRSPARELPCSASYGWQVIYDIIERMGDADEALRDYSTTIDLAWLDRASPAR